MHWPQGLGSADSGSEIANLPSAVHSLAVSRDGTLVAAGRFGRHRGENALSVWNGHFKEMAFELPGAQGRVRTAFSPSDDLLAFSSQDHPDDLKHRIAFLNTSSGEIVDEFNLEGSCEGLEFSQDGAILLAAQFAPGNSAIVRRDVASGTSLSSVPTPDFFGHLGHSEAFALDAAGH
jgi:WD40 repeat protein